MKPPMTPEQEWRRANETKDEASKRLIRARRRRSALRRWLGMRASAVVLAVAAATGLGMVAAACTPQQAYQYKLYQQCRGHQSWAFCRCYVYGTGNRSYCWGYNP